MSRLCLAAVLLLCALGPRCSAQQACPWLTEGTAAALLGGPVTPSAHATDLQGTCTFVSKDPAVPGTLTLTIDVTHQPTKKCTRGEPTPGIGEDTTLCTSHFAGEQSAMLRGRVRSRWFLLSVRGRGPRARYQASLRQALEQAGEEVAGNLF